MFLFKTVIFTLFISVVLSSCSLLKVHKINIDQGNIVTQEAINDLKLGMTKRQAIFVMGTPLVTDPFNSDLWAYYYSVELQNSNKTFEQKTTLKFEDNKLVEIEGDLQPKDPEAEPVVEDDKEPKPTIRLSPKAG